MRHCHCAKCSKPMDHPNITLKVIMRADDRVSRTLYFCWACAQAIDLDISQYSYDVCVHDWGRGLTQAVQSIDAQEEK